MPKEESRPELTADDIQQLARNYQRSRILFTAYELGVFTELGGERKTSAEVASALGTDPRATDRLLSALAILGLLNKEEGRFANAAAAARYTWFAVSRSIWPALCTASICGTRGAR